MIDSSFGTIPIIHKDNHWYVFLIQHRNGKHWGFPKGHKENDEEAKDTAIRELKEETGLEYVKDLFKEPFKEFYRFNKNGQTVEKTVTYFLVEVKGEVQLDPKEILDGGWFLFEEAAKKITFSQNLSLLNQVKKILKIT